MHQQLLQTLQVRLQTFPALNGMALWELYKAVSTGLKVISYNEIQMYNYIHVLEGKGNLSFPVISLCIIFERPQGCFYHALMIKRVILVQVLPVHASVKTSESETRVLLNFQTLCSV